MGSVSDHFSGAASGVNNALTRIANVFANAILGALAVLFFSGALQGQLKNGKLNDKQRKVIEQQAVNLGNAKVPYGFEVKDKAAIEKAYKNSFIAAYGNIMRIAAGLGFLGALMAVLFIRNSAVKKGTD